MGIGASSDSVTTGSAPLGDAQLGNQCSLA